MSSRIKLREIDSLRSIMAGCLRVTQPKIDVNQSIDFYPRRKMKSVSESQSQISMRPTSRMSFNKKQIRSANFNHNSFMNKKQQLSIKIPKQKDKFCGEIVTSKGMRSSFRHAVLKYKKNYHPINASRGSRDTSNERVREPRKIRLFKQEIAQEEQGQIELRRMAVLSQVIAENTRRGQILMRQKSKTRHKTVM